MKVYAGIFCVALAIGIAIGYYLNNKPPEIRIVKETKTEYKYIKKVETCEEYKKAYESPIEITATTNKDWLNVVATDTYKQSEKGFKIGQKQNWNYLIYGGIALFVGGGATVWAIKR